MPEITRMTMGRMVRITTFDAASEKEALTELDRLALRYADRAGHVGGLLAVIDEHTRAPAWRGEFGSVFDLTPLQPALPEGLRDRANHFFRQPAAHKLLVIVRSLSGPTTHVRVWNGKRTGLGGAFTRRD